MVVIGGGVGGCSILYWLTKLGWSDVLLLERAELTSGSTFHSAGLVGQLRSSLSLTRMMMSSVELYRTLGEEVGLETGWREVGSLRLASAVERMEELARQSGWAKTFGLPLELVSAAEAQSLFPPMSTDGVLGAAFLPSDGYIDPSQLTFALAEGARRGGGSVINVASFVAILGAATSQISYTASKGAVLALSRELAVQFAREGIRVNALCPGPVNTPLLRELFAANPEQAQRRLVHVPMGRFAEAEEIAAAVAFLASDDASFITASTFLVDGGISAGYVTPL